MADNVTHSSTKAHLEPDLAKNAVLVEGVAVKNELLLSLPACEREILFPKLIFLPLATHTVLHEAEERIHFGYFLNGGLASVLTVLAEGKSVEVGLTGKEGFVGLPLLVGLDSSPTRVEIQIQASAFRIRARDLAQALPFCPVLEIGLQRYVQLLAMQGSQVAACNRLHDVHQRLARWLLMCQDRIDSALVPLTQEFLAHMLGTRRSSVTLAAGLLQKANLITYHRGEVTIEDRPGLMAAACECYEAMLRQTRNWENEAQESAGHTPELSRVKIKPIYPIAQDYVRA